MSNLIFNNSDKVRKCIDSQINQEHPIVKSLYNNELVFFIGSGLSIHLGIPGWTEFASKYVELAKKSNNINYKTENYLKKIPDKKKILSLCRFIVKNANIDEEEVKSWFNIEEEKIAKSQIYQMLYDLNAIYITTNYDNALDLMSKNKKKNEVNIAVNSDDSIEPFEDENKIFYDVNKFVYDKIMKPGNVIHIHGSKNDLSSMVISNEDYINRYGYNISSYSENPSHRVYSKFLKNVFEGKYTILFMGYGLEEIEILQYMFENTLEKNPNDANNRFMLLGGYASDYGYIDILSQYYFDNYGVTILPYDITEEGYDKEIEMFLSKLIYWKNWKENRKGILKADLELLEDI